MPKNLGPTGRFPRGRLNSDDEGEINLAIGSDPIRHKVVIDFGKSVAWLGMSPDDAEQMAQQLIKHAQRARGGKHE